MDFDETMVEEEFDDTVEDDTLPDGIVEADESEDEEDFPDEEDLELPDEEEVEDEEYSEEEEEETPEPEPPKEPGWIKQRVQKAVDKAVAQALAAQQEQFNAQIAPLIAKMQEDEAQELVRSRKIADIETAREFVRLKNGQQAPVEVPKQQPRNEQGQFASREQIETDTRITELKKQADKIKSKGGPDVISEFMNNEDIKRRVVSGELDFYDVADMMKAKPKRKPPSPMRSPNGAANITPNAFISMSDEQFDRIEKQLDKGVRYTLK